MRAAISVRSARNDVPLSVEAEVCITSVAAVELQNLAASRALGLVARGRFSWSSGESFRVEAQQSAVRICCRADIEEIFRPSPCS